MSVVPCTCMKKYLVLFALLPLCDIPDQFIQPILKFNLMANADLNEHIIQGCAQHVTMNNVTGVYMLRMCFYMNASFVCVRALLPRLNILPYM